MLYYFFSIKQKENAYIFNGLNILNERDALQHQNQYPVIFITLKDMKNNSFEKQKTMFSILIQEILRSNQELLNSKQINEFDKEQIIKFYTRRCGFRLGNKVKVENVEVVNFYMKRDIPVYLEEKQKFEKEIFDEKFR